MPYTILLHVHLSQGSNSLRSFKFLFENRWVGVIEVSARRAWNAETAITGGLVGDDLVSILWNKIAALTGGTTEWPFGLGLRPWYLQVILFLPMTCRTGTTIFYTSHLIVVVVCLSTFLSCDSPQHLCFVIGPATKGSTHPYPVENHLMYLCLLCLNCSLT